MVVHNPNNWHWVDKNCIDWAKSYFKEKLVGLSTNEDENKFATIKQVSSVEGDCEVNQRKGKVISLFDLKVVMSISGNVDDAEFEGSITVPEIAFDSSSEDYQFEISIYKETNQLSKIKPVIRTGLLPQLRRIFTKFGDELLITHGNDIQIPEEEVISKFTKDNQKSSFARIQNTTVVDSATDKQAVSSGTVKSQNSSSNSGVVAKYNTTTIHIESTFNVAADELYNTFIDRERISLWSRSPVQCNGISSLLTVGDQITMFGGNITSKLVNCQHSKQLVFDWRLNDWHKGHFSKMNIEFHESEEYHETKIVITWSGIPIGEEDKVRGNFEEYYARSIKLTFGFGAVL